MKTKLFQKIAALAVVSGIALSACGGSSGTNSAAAPSSVTMSISQGSSAASGTDGLALLDSLREISETSLPSGDVYSTAVAGDQATVEKLMAENQKPHADSNDAEYDASSATKVTLNGTSATVEGSGVEVSKGVVTITGEGTYILSGTFDGQIVVAASDEAKVKIVLNGAHISSSTDAAIRVNNADEAVIVLAEGSTNSVSDTSSYASDVSGPTAAIASSADLTIGGSGTLNVKGNANDGISSADGLVITGGTINVTAVDDAVRGKDYVVLAAGTLALEAGGDAVKADNETDSGRGYVLLTGGKISGTAGSDLIDATSDVIVAAGSVEATGSEEGIEAAYIYLAGGEGKVTSSDDAINATGG